MEEYKIRRVEKKDVERIWEIRNHPLVRKCSGSSEIIDLERHKNWFHDKYFENKNNFCYVLSNGINLAGYCRFDYSEEGKAQIVSIAIDPENQSRGLGTQLLSQSLKKLKDKQNISVLAEVKKNNIASTKLFEKNGFEKCREDEENYYYLKRL
ncbi:MAG: GNAT family N-acetyltransferase [Candidatus Moranbacteria bacterium]|nr:GNAT family N-acetyltransferase [Candidatus Moranbacteria bacterium]